MAVAVLDALAETAKDTTTPDEAFSAVLTVLNRLLITLRFFEGPGDHVHNARQIEKVLTELIEAHGTVVH